MWFYVLPPAHKLRLQRSLNSQLLKCSHFVMLPQIWTLLICFSVSNTQELCVHWLLSWLPWTVFCLVYLLKVNHRYILVGSNVWLCIWCLHCKSRWTIFVCVSCYITPSLLSTPTSCTVPSPLFLVSMVWAKVCSVQFFHLSMARAHLLVHLVPVYFLFCLEQHDCELCSFQACFYLVRGGVFLPHF